MQYGESVKATPKKGVSFRKEDGVTIDPDGEVVTLNSFWKRRELDGDVTLTAIKGKAQDK